MAEIDDKEEEMVKIKILNNLRYKKEVHKPGTILEFPPEIYKSEIKGRVEHKLLKDDE